MVSELKLWCKTNAIFAIKNFLVLFHRENAYLVLVETCRKLLKTVYSPKHQEIFNK